MTGAEKLLLASARGDFKRVRSLLKGGLFRKPVDANAVGPADQKTALSEAVGNGHHRVAQLLIQSGANVNSKTRRGEAPMLHAFNGSHNAKMVQLLCESGADPNAAINANLTALDRAFQHNDPESVRILARHGADLERCGVAASKNPLDQCPAGSKCDHIVAYMDGQPSLPKSFLKGERNLLRMAVEENNTAAAALLLEAGCQADDTDARPPWHPFLNTAIRNNNLDLVKLLLDHGANPDAPDEHFGSLIVRLFAQGKKAAFEVLVEYSHVMTNETDPFSWHLEALGSPYESVRDAAITYLGNSGDPRAVEPLLGLLRSGRGVATAMLALGKTGDSRAVAAIMEVVEAQKECGRVNGSDHPFIVAINVLREIGDKRAFETVLRAMERLAGEHRLGLLREKGLVDRLFQEYASPIMRILSPHTMEVSRYRGASGDEDETTTYKYDTTGVDKAVKKLCGLKTRVSSNLLHLVTKIQDVEVVTGEGYYFPDGPQMVTLSYESVRQAAAAELQKRGSPAYDPSAYLEDGARS